MVLLIIALYFWLNLLPVFCITLPMWILWMFELFNYPFLGRCIFSDHSFIIGRYLSFSTFLSFINRLMTSLCSLGNYIMSWIRSLSYTWRFTISDCSSFGLMGSSARYIPFLTPPSCISLQTIPSRCIRCPSMYWSYLILLFPCIPHHCFGCDSGRWLLHLLLCSLELLHFN